MKVHKAAVVVPDEVDGVSRGEDRVKADVEGRPGDRLMFDQPRTVARALYGELKRLDGEGKLGPAEAAAEKGKAAK